MNTQKDAPAKPAADSSIAKDNAGVVQAPPRKADVEPEVVPAKKD